MSKDEAVVLVDIEQLRPNNWFINSARLERVRKAWDCGNQDLLPPVLVSIIDGEPGLIDGHARVYAAFENGARKVRAVIKDLDQIEGSKALYMHIHREGPKVGIQTIGDLKDRIVGPEEHKRCWVGYCMRWFEQHRKQG